MIINTQLVSIIQPIIEDLGYELWGCEYYPQGKYSVLRLYIEGEKGITIADCKQVSDQVSAVLEVEQQKYANYTLEVSSPGINRSLYTPAQYRRYIGKMVAIRTRMPLNGQRNFKGVLTSVEDKGVILESEEKSIELSFAEIEKANLA